MQEFTDSAGTAFRIECNAWTARLIHRELGLDLMELANPEELLKFAASDRVLEAVWVLAKQSTGDAGWTEETFLRNIHGDAVGRASDAFVQALIDYFPRQEVRDQLRAIVEADKAVKQKAHEHVADVLAKFDVNEAAKSLVKVAE